MIRMDGGGGGLNDSGCRVKVESNSNLKSMVVIDCNFIKVLEIGTVSTHFEACCLVRQLYCHCGHCVSVL